MPTPIHMYEPVEGAFDALLNTLSSDAALADDVGEKDMQQDYQVLLATLDLVRIQLINLSYLTDEPATYTFEEAPF